MIPLILRLKKERHKEIARAHDLIIETLYEIFGNAVLHGGTAIWRCYKGNRFSEDVDVYLPKDAKKIEAFFESLKKKGFVIEKKKISENSLFSSLNFNNIIARFEALFKKVEGIIGEYETADGNIMTVYTLSPEELIKEKVETYLKRAKIRDLYDIFFLLRHIKDKEKINGELKKLVSNFRKPIDEKELKILILEGLVPDTEKMLSYIKSFVKY